MKNPLNTREEVIDWIANFLWMNGIGNKAGGRIAVEKIVDTLMDQGVLIPHDHVQTEES